MFTAEDHSWMQAALTLAERAASAGEVPVGAVLVSENKIIASAHNQPIHLCDPSAHAEMLALRRAATASNNYRLVNTTLYVTLEPCIMCVGAIVHARVQRLVFGASDPRVGAVTSVFQLLDAKELNHKVDYAGGLMAEECGQVLKDFFQERRKVK